MPIMHSDLTQEARNILFKLHQESRYLGYNLGKQDPRLEYLQFLNRFQSSELIVYIFILIFDYNDAIALEAGRMIEERFKELNSIDLIRLDSSIRDFLSENYHYIAISEDKEKIKEVFCPGMLDMDLCKRLLKSDGFNNFEFYDKNVLKKLDRFTHPISLLGLCTFLPSGYVRERALRQLAQFRTGEELPFLLLRLNDWVGEVSRVAKEEVLNRISPQYLSFFVDHLDMVERIYSWQRENHSDILKAIEEALGQFDPQKNLCKALKHPNFRARRVAIQIASKKYSIPFLELYNTISHDPDPIVRLIYVKNIQDHLDKSQLYQLTECIKNDRFSRVRKEGLYIAINNKFNNALTLALDALCDSHSSMRELARWFLTKKGCSKNYFQEVYRNHLLKNPYHIGAILGLGEVGEEVDAQLFLPLLSHPMAKLKKASFTAISNIKPNLLKDFVVNALENGTSREIQIASKFIIKNSDHFPISDLWELYQKSINTTFKLRILFLFDDFIKFKWTKLLFLLKASEEASSDILAYVENRIVNFSFYPYCPPSNEEAAYINEAMKKSLLSKHALEKIKSLLKGSNPTN